MSGVIKLNTNFVARGQGLRDFELRPGLNTIADLLVHVGEEISFRFIDPNSRKLEKEMEIIINGKELWFYSDGIETPLKDGDTVEIYLIPMGGG